MLLLVTMLLEIKLKKNCVQLCSISVQFSSIECSWEPGSGAYCGGMGVPEWGAWGAPEKDKVTPGCWIIPGWRGCWGGGVVGSYFLGRPRDRWRLFTNSASSTIQNDPKSSSYRTKHLCSDRLVRMAFWSINNHIREKQRKVKHKNTEKKVKIPPVVHKIKTSS